MCSYCGCESIAVVGRFMAEHTEIINASGQLRRACASDDAEAIRDAADAVGALLDPHTRAEEVGIFAVMAEDPEFTDYVTRLCEEHHEIDRLLAAVVAAPDSATRHTAYGAFERLIRGHIDREDNSLFPAAAIAFAGPEWERVDALTPPA